MTKERDGLTLITQEEESELGGMLDVWREYIDDNSTGLEDRTCRLRALASLVRKMGLDSRFQLTMERRQQDE